MSGIGILGSSKGMKSTKMKQPGISRITEADWTGAGIPRADSSGELMKICTKILTEPQGGKI